MEAVLGALDGPRDRALFVLGLCSGFRITELLSLTLGDVAPLGHISDQVSVRRKNMKKKRAGRTVVLHQWAKEVIGIWIDCLRALGHIDPKTFLFLSRQGQNQAIGRTMAWNVLTSAYRKVGLSGKLGCHALRKTYCGNVHEALGHDLIKTQAAMDHADLNSTVCYLSFKREDIDRAILGLYKSKRK